MPLSAAAVLACVCLLACAPRVRADVPNCGFYLSLCPDHKDRPACVTCPCPPGWGPGPQNSGGQGNPGGTGVWGSQQGGEPKTTTLCAICGLAKWWVSEPAINLRFEDEPIGYQPSRGPRMSFRLSYRQRGSISEVDEVFGVGPQWSCSLRAFLVDRTATDGTFRLHRGGAGAIVYQPYVVQYLDGSLLTQVPGGYQVQYTDGSAETFTAAYTGSGAMNSAVCYFLTARKDPAGNAMSFTYAAYNDAMQLETVTDLDSNRLHLYYTNTTFTNLITVVTDDASRMAVLEYDEAGYLTNITDVAGISGSFQYDATTARRGWITNFTTHVGAAVYASTGFEHGGQDAENNAITTAVNGPNRYLQVNLPDGGHELYLYRHDGSGINMPTTYTEPAIMYFGSGTLDNVDQDMRNSFKWGPLQYSGLSTTDPDNLTANDYLRGRLYHWLKEAGDDSPSTTLSLERTPCADSQDPTPGQVTWYDYDGKSANNRVGTNAMPCLVAQVLPDTTTRFTRYTRNSRSLVTSQTSTYTGSDGNTALRTEYFYYDATAGLDLEQHVGPLGNQIISNYFNPSDPPHRPSITYDALNQPTFYSYNAFGQLEQVERPGGLITTNYYPASGNSQYRLAQSIDLQIQRTNTYTHYATGLLATHTDERGMTVTYYWDALQRLTGQAFPDDTTRSNRYELLDLSATKDRLDQWTGFGYDSLRRKVAETNVNGVITRYGYCDCGGLRYLTNGWGSADEQYITLDYDNQGHRTFTHLPDRTLTNVFNSLGQVSITGDARGWRTNYYNNQGLLWSVDSVYGNEQFILFDIEDHPWYVIDANGVTLTNTFDALGRLNTRGYPDGGVEKFGYAANGLVAYTNQLDKVTRYFNDAAGRRVWETNANSEWIQYYYDSSGNLTNLVDGKGQSTQWGYDLYGRVTNKLDQAGVEILRYGYDPEGRLTTRWSKAKGTTAYSYDPVGNLTNINYPASTDVRFTFDALNRLKTMVDAAGTTEYAYTLGGQLWTENGPFDSDTVTSTYANGLRTALSLEQPSGAWTNGFGYDLAGRLTNVTSQAGSHGYLLGATAAGSPLVQRLTLPNTAYITNTYDTVARLATTYLRSNSAAMLNKHEYTYNTGGQRVQQIRVDDTYVDYFYDPIGQLTNADCSVAAEDRGYFYDSAWNLNRRTNNGATQVFQVDNKNQLTNAISQVMTFDDNGNMVTASNGCNVLVYDDENRLTQWFFYQNGSSQPGAGDKRTDFVYDGQSRLRKRIEFTWSQQQGTNPPPDDQLSWQLETLESENPGEATNWMAQLEVRYIYDGKRVIQERNGYNVPAVSYTRGTDLSGSLEGAGGIGGLLARSAGYSGGTWTEHGYYHADGNGNISRLINASQGSAAYYRYDPFGNMIGQSGTHAAANVYRFSSKEIHTNSGLYYYLYRFYSPNWQRWINRDPIGRRGGINLYGFVANSPSKYLDSEGLTIRFDPSASMAFIEHWRDCICQLAQSPTGRYLLERAARPTIDIVIRMDAKGPAAQQTSNNDDYDRGGSVPTIPIGLDPNHPLGVGSQNKDAPPMDEQVPPTLSGCAAVLAHELGHASEDEYDEVVDGEWGGLNVSQNENPVRVELGLPPRRTYHGWPIWWWQ